MSVKTDVKRNFATAVLVCESRGPGAPADSFSNFDSKRISFADNPRLRRLVESARPKPLEGLSSVFEPRQIGGTFLNSTPECRSCWLTGPVSRREQYPPLCPDLASSRKGAAVTSSGN